METGQNLGQRRNLKIIHPYTLVRELAMGQSEMVMVRAAILTTKTASRPQYVIAGRALKSAHETEASANFQIFGHRFGTEGKG